ncbi:hypothetical protein Bca4012_037240 [Brassica carinata]
MKNSNTETNATKSMVKEHAKKKEKHQENLRNRLCVRRDREAEKKDKGVQPEGSVILPVTSLSVDFTGIVFLFAAKEEKERGGDIKVGLRHY